MPKGVVPADHKHRCTAHTTGTGERCKNAAIKGGNVCRAHGGAAGQVRRSARQRFNDLVDPMIRITHNLTDEALAGKLSAQERIALIKFIADRTGFVPGQAVSIEGDVAPWEKAMLAIVRELPPDYEAARQTFGNPLEIEDAVVVEESEPDPTPIVLGSADPPRRRVA